MYIGIDILILSACITFLFVCWGHAAWQKNYQARKLLLRMNDIIFTYRRRNDELMDSLDFLIKAAKERG